MLNRLITKFERKDGTTARKFVLIFSDFKVLLRAPNFAYQKSRVLACRGHENLVMIETSLREENLFISRNITAFIKIKEIAEKKLKK